MPNHATKIVATLGPASSDPEVLEAMIRAGVNVVRLNFSHGKAQDHVDRATLVREAAKRAGRVVAIMADLQGPKIRVGKFAEGKVMLLAGAPFVLDASRTEPGDIQGVGLDYKELPRDVKTGDLLLLNDGLIVLTVDKVSGEQVHTTVKMGGELSNNKGINKQGGGLTEQRHQQTRRWTDRASLNRQGHGRHQNRHVFSSRLRGRQLSEKRHRHGNGPPTVQCRG